MRKIQTLQSSAPTARIDRARRCSIIDAATLAHNLGGKWRGNWGNAPCPVCQPERRRDQQALSLRMDGGRLLAFCHKAGCAFRDIAKAAGLPPDEGKLDAIAQRKAAKNLALDMVRREWQAKEIWDHTETTPIHGTPAETYLCERGITCALPDTLRFNSRGWHSTGHHHPMMLALVEGAAGFAVHRTYLRGDGMGKADVTPDKAMLGPCAGGAVRLSHGEGPLVVCEGVETGLSLMCGLLSNPATVWAALSTSGMRGLQLPPMPGRLTIAADGDVAGREASHALATKADALGWRVSLLPAPDGQDWNDVLSPNDGKLFPYDGKKAGAK